MRGQRHATAALYPGKDPVPIVQEAGWAPGPVWTGGKSRPHRNSIPGPSSPWPVAIPTELPGPKYQKTFLELKVILISFRTLIPIYYHLPLSQLLELLRLVDKFIIRL